MTKEELRALTEARDAEASAQEKYELAVVLRGHVSEYYDQGGPVQVDVTQVRKDLVLQWLDDHVEDCLAAWNTASVALQELLGRYGEDSGPDDNAEEAVG